MEALKEYPHLPGPGALKDQDQLLMENIYRIMAAVNRLSKPRTNG